MPLIFDISDFHQTLYNEALILFQCFDIYHFNKTKSCIEETRNADKVREALVSKKQIRPMWMTFSAGYELLFKAVLTKHQSLYISSKKISTRTQTFNRSMPLAKVLKVYDFVNIALIQANNNLYLKSELNKYKIAYLYDFSSGTLGDSLGNLKKLVDKKIITEDEHNLLYQSSQTLVDIRRNIDAHTFYGLTVVSAINGDLEEVYLPAINLLIDIYHR